MSEKSVYRIHPLKSTFYNWKSELKFRQWLYPERYRQVRIALWLTATVILLFTFSDLKKLPPGKTYFSLLGIRVALMITAAISHILINKKQYKRSFNQIVFAYTIAGVSALGVIFYVMAPMRAGGNLVNEVMVIFAIYLFIPNVFAYTVSAGLIASATFISVQFLYVIPLGYNDPISVFGLFFVTNMVGIYYSSLMHKTRRHEFIDLLKEQETRRRLEKEILRRKKLERKYKKLATTDPLTGVYNRRYFLKSAMREMERSQRYNVPLTVFIIDIDLFKNINDQYGHHIGDQALVEFSLVLQKNLRTSDTLARLGGEEFAILAPEVDTRQAEILGEKLRKRIEEYFNEKHYHLTASIGGTVYTSRSATEKPDIETLLHRADSALYRAKSRGRNRVEFIQGAGAG